jgi:hypothetical protein
MSLVSRIKKAGDVSITKTGDKDLFFGMPGVGKSTLASQADSPLFVDFDRGIKQLRVDRVDPAPKTWLDALATFREVAAEKHAYKTLVIDTIDPLEDLAIQHVCKIGRKESLGDFDYGDGYAALKNEWRNMLSILDSVADKGMVVCLLAHSMVRQTSDPQLGPYEVYTTGLQKGTWAVTARWCDMIGFCAFQNARIKDEKRSVYTGQRELLTTAGSGYVAKNRWGLPRTLPMDWKQLDAAIKRFYDTARPEEVVARIQALTKDNADFQKKAEFYIADAKGDVRRLLQVEDAIKEKIAEMAREVAEAAKEGTTAA